MRRMLSQSIHQALISERGAPFLFKLKYPENAYGRRCAVSGERTVPALEAAHIKPYAESGPHAIANGLLLRSDIHRLFDRGYLTVAEDYSVEVSRRIKEEYENGRDYYRYHGQKLEVLPARIQEQPGGGYLRWHNEHVYRA